MDARILVASGVVGDARVIEKLLGDEFDEIAVSTDKEQAVQDFEGCRPQVLVLALQPLEQAERFYLGLFRHSSLIHGHPHRTLVLCNKDEVRRAYDLCKHGQFDDYVLFWPHAHDAPRLHMAIHRALRELKDVGVGAPSAAEFASQARRVAELEGQLDRYLATGRQHVDGANRSLGQAEQDIAAALDRLARRLPNPDRQGPDSAEDREELRRKIDRIKVEELDQRLKAVGDAMRPVGQWIGSIKDGLSAQLGSARTLGAMAEQVRPFVLAVDDEPFQHRLLAQALAELNLELVFAVSGSEGLAALRGRRPDIILMDVNLSDVDGIEVTRQIKAIERLADVPVIMITGRSEKKLVIDSLQAGASDFVVKPFDRNNLIGKMRRYLG